MKKDEAALKIGKHILETYESWLKRPMGKTVSIPVLLPHTSDQPPWAMTINLDCPWFIESYFENGEIKFKHWTLNEYMGWKE